MVVLKEMIFFFGCEHSGQSIFQKMRDTYEFIRRSGSKKCGCPFHLKGQQWILKVEEWTLRVICGVHSHPAIKYIEDHL